MNVHYWWKVHCTMEDSSKTKPSRKENPLAPFATSHSGICTWSLKPSTQLSLIPGPVAADLVGLSRDCPTGGLPSDSLSTWNSEHTLLPALDRLTEIAI